MGSSSSRCAARPEPSCQEAERPSSQASEICIIGSSSSDSTDVEQVSAVDCYFRNGNSSTREAPDESLQQIKQEALGSAEIRGRRVYQPSRILSRTRQVNMDSFTRVHSRQSGMVREDNPRILYRTMQVNTDSPTRFPLREGERLSEAGHGQYNIEEVQSRLRSYTGSSPSPSGVEVERNSSLMDIMHRVRQGGADSSSQTRINDFTSIDMTSWYNSTRALSSHRGRTGRFQPYGQGDGCDAGGSAQYDRRIASDPSHHADLRGPIFRGERTGRDNRIYGGRRRFWDALTIGASQRRLSNYPGSQEASGRVFVPRNRRSALPNRRSETMALPNEEREGHNSFRNRSLNLDERRHRFRSQVWAFERLSTNFEGVPGHPRPCARRGRHETVEQSPATTQTNEDTDTRASISRIIMLAEALFQVLDEIHRQSVALSQSAGLSLGSLRAPDAVVESMPVRIFQDIDTVESKEEAAVQCHICLVEYEGGDLLRVLPCSHEYHMTCIDKWLREVHRVCPLCRGDVCELKAIEK